MSITLPRFLGVVVRKNAKTQSFVRMQIAIQKIWEPDALLNEDDYLAGFSVAMNPADLSEATDRLKDAGAIEGVDFVITSSIKGILGEMPSWLQVEEGETIDMDSPELSSKLLRYCVD